MARQRLSGFLRHAGLVAQQEAALEAGEMERFAALSESIGELQEEIGMPHSDEIQELEGKSTDTDEEAIEALRGAVEGSARVQARLATMKLERAEEIRRMTRSGSRARDYLVKDRASPESAKKLDVRF